MIESQPVNDSLLQRAAADSEASRVYRAVCVPLLAKRCKMPAWALPTPMKNTLVARLILLIDKGIRRESHLAGRECEESSRTECSCPTYTEQSSSWLGSWASPLRCRDVVADPVFKVSRFKTVFGLTVVLTSRSVRRCGIFTSMTAYPCFWHQAMYWAATSS